MNAVEMRKKGNVELAKHLVDLQQEQFRLRMSKATGQLSHTHKLAMVRREIARTRTVMAQIGN